MLNRTIDGIAVKLHETFGDEYTFYTEDVPQDLREPAFVITHLITLNSAKLPYRYLRKQSFDIKYFPKSKNNPKSEMYEVAEKMLIALEYINVLHNETFDNLCRGTKMQYEIVENILHFFVNYDFFVKKEIQPDEYMESLIINSKAEG